MKLEYAYFDKTPVFKTKQSNITKYIEEKIREISDAYHYYERSRVDNWKVKVSQHLQLKKCFEEKKCVYCGGNLKFNSAYGFWGCINYDRINRHSTFQHNQQFYYPVVNIHRNWISDIINKCDMTGKVKVKELYDWLIENNFEDLREKYLGNTSESYFMGLVKAKSNSISQEKRALNYIKSKYLGVAYQQCIKYKFYGQPEKFCIPDFIAGDTSIVKVIDAKLDHFNDEKMDLYVFLVSYIVRARNDYRKVTGAHIIDGEFYQDSRYEIIKLPVYE